LVAEPAVGYWEGRFGVLGSFRRSTSTGGLTVSILPRCLPTIRRAGCSRLALALALALVLGLPAELEAVEDQSWVGVAAAIGVLPAPAEGGYCAAGTTGAARACSVLVMVMPSSGPPGVAMA
jgi:hypothetical protein